MGPIPVQQFASPTEALAHISEQAWSNFTKADYTLQQWHAACLIHVHDGEPTSKSQCKLPVKTPDGTLNRNGVHAAAAALAGARGGLKGVSDEQKKKAGSALKRYYSQLDEDPPESLAEHSIISFREKPGSPEDLLEHYGVKGMRWGVRKANRDFSKIKPLRDKAVELDTRSVEKGRIGRSVLQRRARNLRLESNRLEIGIERRVMDETNKAAKKDLAVLRKDPRFQNINYRDAKGRPQFDVKKFKALEKEESRIWTDHLNKNIKDRGYEFSVETSRNSWRLIPKRIKHATEELESFTVEIIRDEDGFFVEARLPEELNEIQIDHRVKPGSPEDILEHYGVKGMRWGVRKSEEVGGKASEVKPLKRTSSGKIVAPPLPKPLSARSQRRVDKFVKRADVANTRISDLKIQNEKLKGTKNPIKQYDRYLIKQDIKALDKAQSRALKDAEAVKKGKLTSTQKKMIIGGVVVGAIAAGVMIQRGQQSGALNSYKLLAQARLRGQKVPFKVNKDLSKSMSASDILNKVVKPVNPNYSQMGGKMNCRRATYAYELRRRGFDVHATTSAVGWGQSESGVINAVTTEGRDFYRRMSMSEAVIKTGSSSVASGDTRINPIKKLVLDNLDVRGKSNYEPAYGSKRVFEALSKQPNGARGEVLFKFPGFGHSMAFEVVDGRPHIFDSQKGTYHDLSKLVEDKWGNFNGAEITRLDNVDLDLNFLTRWATNRG